MTRRRVFPLPQVDPACSANAEHEPLHLRLCRCLPSGLRKLARFERPHVGENTPHVAGAHPGAVAVGAEAETQILPPAPGGQVVAASESGPGVVRYLVLHQVGLPGGRLDQLVLVGLIVWVGGGGSSPYRPPQSGDGRPPRVERFPRGTEDQIDSARYVREAHFEGGQRLLCCVQPAQEAQHRIVKALYADRNPVDAGRQQPLDQFLGDILRIRFDADFCSGGNPEAHVEVSDDLCNSRRPDRRRSPAPQVDGIQRLPIQLHVDLGVERREIALCEARQISGVRVARSHDGEVAVGAPAPAERNVNVRGTPPGGHVRQLDRIGGQHQRTTRQCAAPRRKPPGALRRRRPSSCASCPLSVSRGVCASG